MKLQKVNFSGVPIPQPPADQIRVGEFEIKANQQIYLEQFNGVDVLYLPAQVAYSIQLPFVSDLASFTVMFSSPVFDISCFLEGDQIRTEPYRYSGTAQRTNFSFLGNEKKFDRIDITMNAGTMSFIEIVVMAF